MGRKQCRRKQVVAVAPRGLRPRLTREQIRALSLAHHTNLDAIATGTADRSTLWQWVEGCLTWSRVSELLHVGTIEMTAQLRLVTDVVNRYGRTGRVLFTGPEYQAAKAAVGYMDDLAELVDEHNALIAVAWSQHRCAAISASARQCRSDAQPEEAHA